MELKNSQTVAQWWGDRRDIDELMSSIRVGIQCQEEQGPIPLLAKPCILLAVKEPNPVLHVGDRNVLHSVIPLVPATGCLAHLIASVLVSK